MRYLIQILAVFFIMNTAASAQEIVSITEGGKYTKQQITSIFSIPLISYGAKYYKVTYKSVDAKGALDTLSGLLVVPDNANFTYPTLVYQHGTSDCKTCVPSRFGVSGGEEGQLGLLFAGLGYVSILPDYVGMGDGRGFQTYVHAATTVSATEDMVNAIRSWVPDNGISINDQLFITGYSQGGYASMAYQESMQEKYGAKYVTGAAHLSGPYSISGVMRDLILGEDTYFFPAYVPNTVMGMNEVYEFYDHLDEFFRPEYVDDIQSYYDGNLSLTNLNSRLIQKLIANTGASVGGRLIRQDVLDAIISDPENRVNEILKENDVYKWKPESPTRIFYCKADDQVPYLNSIVARDSMYARGASESILVVTDVNSNADHGGCVTPALTQTLLFFLGLQKITTSTQNVEPSMLVHVYPNPAQDKIFITGNSENVDVIIWDMDGRQRIVTQDIASEEGINVSGLQSGLYIITLSDRNGVIANKKIIIND